MDKELKNNILSILHPQKKEPIFNEEDIITCEIQDFLYNEKSFSKMGLLFSKTQKTPRKQKIERICSICKKKFIAEYCLDKVLNAIKFNDKNDFCCEKHKKEYESYKKELYNKELSEIEKHKEKQTDDYIKTYLDPSNFWKPKVKNRVKIGELERNVNFTRIAEYIQNMNYQDFLNTPYWAAISEKVKMKNDYCCELCGKRSYELNVHHPNYDFHGYELQNIKKLKCLCKDCHTKYHFD